MGSATFTIVSPQSSSNITGTIVASEVTGAKTATFMQNYTASATPSAPSVAKYDFNGGNLDTATGRTSVRGNTVFSTALGYGWLTGVNEFQRTVASTPINPSLYRDGAWDFGTGTFRVAVAPSGSYTARVYVGDSFANRFGITVMGENGAVVSYDSVASQYGFVTVTGNDVNNDGFFDIRISTIGGGGIWVANGIDITATTPGFSIISVSGPGTGTADGQTISTFAISGATANSQITVSSAGEIQGTDASTALPGFQVMTDFGGNATVNILAPQSLAAMTDTIRVQDVFGGLEGIATQNFSGSQALRFDFNAGSNDNATNFAAVRGNTLYSAATGFGWVRGVNEFERTNSATTATNKPLYRDGAWGNNFDGTFQVLGAANTTYEARVYIGDSFTNYNGIQVSAMGGTPVASVTPTKNFGFVIVSGTTGANGIFTIRINTTAGNAIWVANGIDIAIVGGLPAMPLTLNIAQTVFAPEASSVTPLSQADLDAIAVEAVNRWIATGISAEQADALRSVRFQVGDLLSTGRLGEQSPGTITIDATAGGLGWFIDSTPGDDSEYTSSNGRLIATSGSALSGIDLLTVVMHELGHQLGYADLDTEAANGSIMSDLFANGERRLPTSTSTAPVVAAATLVATSVAAVEVAAEVPPVVAVASEPIITITKPTAATATNLNVAALRGGEEIVELQLASSPVPIEAMFEDDFAFWGVPLTSEAKPMLKKDDLNISITSLSTSDVSIAWPMWHDDDAK